ncbi:hypothetical protein [Brachybacterium subflavum]|uniref:hypothetical protein n=1 Tax=Brachybacterium subflavum TaxID=2585206 RepID=UPI00126684FC|nr:hypothetical protein [Brachybacterium subflavum]
MTPIPDVADYVALGLMAPDPPADACPYCDRTGGHEPDCSESGDFTPSRYTPTRWKEEHPW